MNEANPNGDPLGGNLPRTTLSGLGYMSDESVKRKIRNRLQDMGQRILIQTNDRSDDGFFSIKSRLEAVEGYKEAAKDQVKAVDLVCKNFADVRAFGAVIALKGGISIGVRGPVTIQNESKTVEPVYINQQQITKSTSSEKEDGKGSDTMGTKAFVEHGLYVINGSINARLAKKTGLSDEDISKIKEALRTLFVNDESAARPAGSIEVVKVYWWEHDSIDGKYSPSKVFDSVLVKKKEGVEIPHSIDDYQIDVKELEGLSVQVVEGF